MVMTSSQRLETAHEVFLSSRREHLVARRNPYRSPALARVVNEPPRNWEAERYPWHYQTRATIFWVGEEPTERNPTPNSASSWDPDWAINFGGYDDPDNRQGYLPRGFRPRMNAFYVALPFNDIGSNGRHKAEADDVVPWFWRNYQGPTVSVCHDRWVMLHHKGRVCYAQWKDVGPWRTNDWEYVFKGYKPRPNPNKNAGIDLSPAVRDHLGMTGNGLVDWRFVEDYEVKSGPWADWMAGDPRAGPFLTAP
jgi:hypothetical protein